MSSKAKPGSGTFFISAEGLDFSPLWTKVWQNNKDTFIFHFSFDWSSTKHLHSFTDKFTPGWVVGPPHLFIFWSQAVVVAQFVIPALWSRGPSGGRWGVLRGGNSCWEAQRILIWWGETGWQERLSNKAWYYWCVCVCVCAYDWSAVSALFISVRQQVQCFLDD